MRVQAIVKPLPLLPLNEDDFWEIARDQNPHWFSSDVSNVLDQTILEWSETDKETVKVVFESSETDPDSGYMVRDGKPKGFFYLDHRTVDGAHSLITDIHVTAGNVHDSIPYLSRLDRQRDRFGFDVCAVGLDAGYFTAGIAKGLDDREIDGVIGYRRPTHRKGYLRKKDFVYLPENDGYRCPQGEILPYSTTNRAGYREYKSSPKICKTCPLREACTQSRTHTKS